MFMNDSLMILPLFFFFITLPPLFFFFNATATTEIYTLSLHDALPIYAPAYPRKPTGNRPARRLWRLDRKSTRLNSSHGSISYAVFCLKKKRSNMLRLRLVRMSIMTVYDILFSRRI